MRSFYDLAFLLPFLYGVAESTLEKQKCYQCEVRESAQCTDEYLQNCPETQTYDRCMTRIYKTKDDQAWIQKSCALAPCSMRDAVQATGLGLDNCDRSQNEYDCVSCCKENGCNTGGGAICWPSHALMVAAVLAAALRSKGVWRGI